MFDQCFTRKILKLTYLYSFRKIQTTLLLEAEITLPCLKYNSGICPVGEMIARNRRKDGEGSHLDWVWSGLLATINLCKHSRYPLLCTDILSVTGRISDAGRLPWAKLRHPCHPELSLTLASIAERENGRVGLGQKSALSIPVSHNKQ